MTGVGICVGLGVGIGVGIGVGAGVGIRVGIGVGRGVAVDAAAELGTPAPVTPAPDSATVVQATCTRTIVTRRARTLSPGDLVARDRTATSFGILLPKSRPSVCLFLERASFSAREQERTRFRSKNTLLAVESGHSVNRAELLAVPRSMPIR